MKIRGEPCVLVVDDDANIRRMLVTFLQRRGFSPTTACNGREALAEMRDGRTDLVLMDLMMPEVSGWDVLRARADEPLLQKIRMIVISAIDPGVVRPGMAGQHVCAVLGKPFDLDLLLATVLRCMECPDAPVPIAA